MLSNWTCPYCPQCLHPAEVHIEDPDDLSPMCCVKGCRCGPSGAPVATPDNEPLTFTAVRSALAGMCRTCWRQDAHQYWCDVPRLPAPVQIADTADWNTASGGDDLP